MILPISKTLKNPTKPLNKSDVKKDLMSKFTQMSTKTFKNFIREVIEFFPQTDDYYTHKLERTEDFEIPYGLIVDITDDLCNALIWRSYHNPKLLSIIERYTNLKYVFNNKTHTYIKHPISDLKEKDNKQMKSNLKEAMARKGDLIDMFLPLISVDEFEPKIGKSVQVIVVAFYLFDEKAADDFRSFLERGTTILLDSEVSPNPDKHGHWLVFVEFRRNKDFWEKFENTLEEATRLIGSKMKWKVRPYFGNGKVYDPADPALKDNIVLEPADYIIRRKHKLDGTDVKESLENFFKDALSIRHTIDDTGTLILEYRTPGRYTQKKEKLYFKTHVCGNTQKILESDSPEAVEMGYLAREVVVLSHMLGESYTVDSTENKIYIEHKDKILILNRYE